MQAEISAFEKETAFIRKNRGEKERYGAGGCRMHNYAHRKEECVLR